MQDLFTEKSFKGFDYLLKKTTSEDLEAPYIFIMHGYGANAQDLAPLANYFDPQALWNWVFIQAPVSLPMMANARAWFPIDEQALQRAMMTGIPRDFASQKVEGLDSLTHKLAEFVNELSQGAPVTIGGFSQGAMMSFHLHHQIQNLKCLILMSGAPIDLNKFKSLESTSISVVPVLITHGTQDPVVSFSQGRKYYEILSDLKVYDVELCSFHGAHEIGQKALDKISNFLKLNLGK